MEVLRKNPFLNLFRARDKPRNAISAAPTFFFGSAISGKQVNPKNAVQVSAVYACVRVIAETIAGLPVGIYESTDTGNRKASEHPLHRLLHDEPNPEMTGFIWRETVLSHLLLWGNSYSQIISDNSLRSLYSQKIARLPVRSIARISISSCLRLAGLLPHHLPISKGTNGSFLVIWFNIQRVCDIKKDLKRKRPNRVWSLNRAQVRTTYFSSVSKLLLRHTTQETEVEQCIAMNSDAPPEEIAPHMCRQIASGMYTMVGMQSYPEMEKAAQMLLDAHTVYLYGIGASDLPALDLILSNKWGAVHHRRLDSSKLYAPSYSENVG